MTQINLHHIKQTGFQNVQQNTIIMLLSLKSSWKNLRSYKRIFPQSKQLQNQQLFQLV